MKVYKILYFLFVFTCLQNVEQVNAQSEAKEAKFLYFQAMEMFNYEYYNDALPMFIKLLNADKNNANLNFYVGVCYLNSSKVKTMALPYLLKAVKKIDPEYSYSFKETSAPVQAYQYLGEVLMLDYKFDDAIRNFNTFKTFLTDKPKDKEFLDDANRDIEMANNAKELIANPIQNISIKPLDILNSPYTDYGLIPSVKGDIYYFSSKRKGNSGSEQDPIGGFFDDIYFVQYKDKKWSKPKKMTGKFNSKSIDVITCASADQKTLYFYRLVKDYFDIYYSTLSTKNKWMNPKKLEGAINGKNNETNASISHDGNTIYFVSDRPEGNGGTDIYVSEKLSTGEWSPARNLGATVNTPYDEDYPFLSADGATLYFSSKGHKSMGGFDIFQSTMSEEGIWSEPDNIGYPINTPFDDVSFNISADGKKGYYATAKKGGYGELDIFEINFEVKAK